MNEAQKAVTSEGFRMLLWLLSCPLSLTVLGYRILTLYRNCSWEILQNSYLCSTEKINHIGWWANNELFLDGSHVMLTLYKRRCYSQACLCSPPVRTQGLQIPWTNNSRPSACTSTFPERSCSSKRETPWKQWVSCVRWTIFKPKHISEKELHYWGL